MWLSIPFFFVEKTQVCEKNNKKEGFKKKFKKTLTFRKSYGIIETKVASNQKIQQKQFRASWKNAI